MFGVTIHGNGSGSGNGNGNGKKIEIFTVSHQILNTTVLPRQYYCGNFTEGPLNLCEFSPTKSKPDIHHWNPGANERSQITQITVHSSGEALMEGSSSGT